MNLCNVVVKHLSSEAVYSELVNAVLSFDADIVLETTRKALDLGLGPGDIIENGLGKGLKIVGEKCEKCEIWLMHLVAAAEAAQRATVELLEPEILKRKEVRKSLGKVVIGTVAGDIHDIGKNIVRALLTAAGFEVHDLGKDVPVKDFISKVKETNANILAASALLTSTAPVQKDIVEALKKEGLREKVKVMVGGSAVSAEWAEEIGADGYAPTAATAVALAQRIIRTK